MREEKSYGCHITKNVSLLVPISRSDQKNDPNTGGILAPCRADSFLAREAAGPVVLPIPSKADLLD